MNKCCLTDSITELDGNNEQTDPAINPTTIIAVGNAYSKYLYISLNEIIYN